MRIEASRSPFERKLLLSASLAAIESQPIPPAPILRDLQNGSHKMPGLIASQISSLKPRDCRGKETEQEGGRRGKRGRRGKKQDTDRIVKDRLLLRSWR